MTHSVPVPGISGDRIRVFHLMRELKRRGWTVRLWSLATPHDPGPFADALDAVTDEAVLVEHQVKIGERFGRLALDVAHRRAFQAHWFWSRSAARAAELWLADAADEPVLVEQLYMYPYVPKRLKGQIVLDTQNHEAARMRAIAQSEGGIGRRSIARLQVGAVERYERDALRSVGTILAVSASEAEAFERIAPGRVRVVPNGVDVDAIKPLANPPTSRDLLFVGSLSYSANRDAIRYFVGEIAPRLSTSKLSLTVVGSAPAKAVHDVASRSALPVVVAGYVPDVGPYLSASRAMIVPLRHGAGTRLKILEALAWGLPVVTTSIGGAGLDLTDGEHGLIADDPKAFAAAIVRLVDDDVLWRRISQHGRQLVEQRYAWTRIGRVLDTALRDLGD